MKSIIQDGKSIEQAISKAWEEAGNPKEFFVKIIDIGEKGFMGFTKRQSIISISFSIPNEKKINKPVKEKRRESTNERLEVSPTKHEVEPNQWTDELASITTEILKEMIRLIGSNISLKYELSGKTLTVTLGNTILSDQNSERNLCASFSFLILQTIKRSVKKKLRGFRLRIEPAFGGSGSENTGTKENEVDE